VEDKNTSADFHTLRATKGEKERKKKVHDQQLNLHLRKERFQKDNVK
jgi:hypothetical protein